MDYLPLDKKTEDAAYSASYGEKPSERTTQKWRESFIGASGTAVNASAGYGPASVFSYSMRTCRFRPNACAG
jgi:hypothetical protein